MWALDSRPNVGRYVVPCCSRVIPITQIPRTPVRWPLKLILSDSILYLSLPSLHSKQQGEEGYHEACASPPCLELTQPPALRESWPYPTHSLRAAGKLCERYRAESLMLPMSSAPSTSIRHR